METSGWIAGQYHLTKNEYSGVTAPPEQGYIFSVLYSMFLVRSFGKRLVIIIIKFM